MRLLPTREPDGLQHPITARTDEAATSRRRARQRISWIAFAAMAILGGVALGGGCGDSEPAAGTTAVTSTSADTSTSTSTGGGQGGMGEGGKGGAGGTESGGGGAGGSVVAYACDVTAVGSTRGSAIALSPDEATLVVVHRDVGSASVVHVDYADGQPGMTEIADLDLGAGTEPWQVAIDACGKRAYVVLRKEQRVVVIEDLDTVPVLGATVSVGSEPTAIAITPNNKSLYVSNWVDGTLSRIDLATMTATSVDLNKPLADTGLIGTVAPRPALAHPRAIAITNNGDASDDDERVYVTEWFAQRTAAESIDGKNSDTNKQGLVYSVGVLDAGVSTIALGPVSDTGFLDHNNGVTGCFPNQIGSITIEGNFAYVTSTCASPVGPVGVFQKGQCTTTANCTASFGPTSVCTAGICTLSCVTNADCAALGGSCTLPAGTCSANTTDVKTTTHPALSVIDLAGVGPAPTFVLDKPFDAKGSTRVPLLPTDLGFKSGFGYVTSNGTDAVFRLVFGADGLVSDVGSASNNFINLRKDTSDTLIRNPIGIATAKNTAFAFVADDGSRDVTALSFNAQAIAGNQTDDFRILQTANPPAVGSPEEAVLRGKRFFTTGLGRWSLSGAGWGSCAACHIDGLSDNVTWYFARGPRQSTSLDGTFASLDPTDQRIMNWTAIVDEIADFELNTRGISGGVGALVSATSSPPTNTDRINLTAESPPQQGLQGSTRDIADPAGVSAHPHSKIPDWLEIEAYIKAIRSPRKPTNLVQADVDAGKALFQSAAQANCIGCHSGPKWTISKVFYNAGDGPNAATTDVSAASLSNKDWFTGIPLGGYPIALFPLKGTAVLGTDSRMRFGAPPGFEQIQCILKPVGTITPAAPPGQPLPLGKSPIDVNVVEIRQDMTTGGQGGEDKGFGFNPPSLLGLQVGAPFFHAGNARTLEELLDDVLFAGHHRSAVAQVFVPDANSTKQLVAYLLSIDEDELPTVAIPVIGGTGGDLCFYP